VKDARGRAMVQIMVQVEAATFYLKHGLLLPSLLSQVPQERDRQPRVAVEPSGGISTVVGKFVRQIINITTTLQPLPKSVSIDTDWRLEAEAT
jgi:hypothetical protein